MGTQCAMYDFTLSAELCDDINAISRACSQLFKKWVYQKETGEGGFVHFQGRGSLFNKKRLHELVSLVNSEECALKGCHFSITSNTVHQGCNFSYVMKMDSRVLGPWSDKEYSEPPPMTRQLEGYYARPQMPWHKRLEAIIQQYDERTIHCVINTSGNVCKSLFVEHLEYKQLATELPTMMQMEDLMQAVMGIGPRKCYVVDMPRALKKEGKLAQFFSGLEMIKNGIAYDKRYSFKKVRFNRPNIVVFTNNAPDPRHLSVDRWKLWTIEPNNLTKEMHLVPYVPCAGGAAPGTSGGFSPDEIYSQFTDS